ncbi:hypothetical protein HC02_17040 [Vibrio parahaemolyticus]|nr:hypothetical protein HC02_17040 [Vibrio parahaemolyticus]
MDQVVITKFDWSAVVNHYFCRNGTVYPSRLKLAIWGAEKALPQLKVESIQGSLFPRFALQMSVLLMSLYILMRKLSALRWRLTSAVSLTQSVC